jgi:hypothetical protein
MGHEYKWGIVWEDQQEGEGEGKDTEKCRGLKYATHVPIYVDMKTAKSNKRKE